MSDAPEPQFALQSGQPGNGIRRWWSLRKALRDLQRESPERHNAAVKILAANSPRCWNGLRKIALREKGLRAVSAAKLLYDLGDTQGLFALLEQHSSSEVRREAEGYLDECLRKVGPQRIQGLLEEALRSLELREPEKGAWGLALSIYAMRVLGDFHHILPQELFARMLFLSHPHFESLSVCRSVFPFTAFADYRLNRSEAIIDFYIGATIAAVRRVGVEYMLDQEGSRAFAVLSEAFGHADPQVQFTAIYGLCRLRDPRALPMFQRIASNKKHPLSQDAQRAIELFSTKLPDVLTLVRASQQSVSPGELLRPATFQAEQHSETLLRPAAPEVPPLP